MDATTPDLDALPTEELRRAGIRAGGQAARHRFFWDIFRHLPHADDDGSLDASLGAVGASISDAVSLWREMTGHGYGDQEPLLRAAFIDYLSRHEERRREST